MNRKYKVLEGKFGRLIPIRFLPKEESCTGKISVWECLCDCGKTVFVRSHSLTNGNTRSCGCLRDEIVGGLTRKRPYEHLYNTFVATCGNKRENLITFEEFTTFTEVRECHYCQLPIEWPKHANKGVHRNAYYLDRKDNDLGYTVANAVVCCTRCNFGKSRFFSYKEWVEIGKCIRRMREEAE
jgi:hypothetical protein